MHNLQNITRRDFVLGSVGLTFAFSIPAFTRIGSQPVAGQAHGLSTAWVHIAPDDTITIYAPASEMGQGATTAQALMLAEELDADWNKVQIESSPVDDKTYGNPIFFAYGIMLTAASVSVPAFYDSLRMNGAQARRILIQAAAKHWAIDESGITTEPSQVVHLKTGRRLSYGEVATFAEHPITLPEVALTDLKDPSAFRLIGHDVSQCHVSSKVDGTAQYSIDKTLPDMLYATVTHAPVQGASPISVDSSMTAEIPDLLDIIELPYGVAAIGRTYPAALAAERALQIEWSHVGAVDEFSDQAGLTLHVKAVRDLSQRGVTVHEHGNINATLGSTTKQHQAEYKTDFMYHGQLEPLNSVAWVKDDGKSVEIWFGSQTPSHLIRTIAATLQIPVESITLHRTLLGGAFGNRLEQAHRCVVDSVLLSRETGRPVKVIWSRETDIRCGRYKPITAHHLTAGEDDNGDLIAWRHRISSDEPLAQSDPYRYASGKDYPATSSAGSRPLYDISNLRVEVIRQNTGIRLSPMRGVGATLNAFAAESFIDEIALAKRVDPLELRLKLLAKHPLAQRTLSKVAQMAEWPQAGAGVSFVEVFGTLLAIVVMVNVDDSTGVIHIKRVWSAVDVGIAVQPRNVEAQIVGGIVYGLSNALKERITFVNGVVQQSNFHDYEMLRMGDSPEILCTVMDSDRPPTGAGEASVVGTMPALANAIAARTGRRLRHTPFTPRRMIAALND